MDRRRLQIAYYSKNDPHDKRSWSGTTYYLGQALQKHTGDVHFLGPVHYNRYFDKIIRGMVKFCRVALRSNYVAKYSLLQNWYAVRYLKAKMKGRQYDCIIAPAAAPELGLLQTNIPIIYMGDATYRLYSRFYHKEFNKLNAFSRWEGEHLEKLSLKKSELFIFSSHWAAESAINDYGVPADKVEVLPLGANMDFTPSANTIFDKEKNETLTLLYLAVDWERKGGSIAFDALQSLKKRGLKAKLVVCGCIPPPGFEDPDVEVIPFLNKNIQADHDRFIGLLSSVHFLILPTRADCSLLVACESNAYGVPAITTKTGGVPDIVKDGVNGYCLPYEAGGEAYAEVISEIYTDKERYRALIRSSRKRYEDVLNWDKWTAAFAHIYEKHFGKKKGKKKELAAY